MVRFEKLAIETKHPYEDATVAADYKNGAFGSVTSGVFTIGATGFKVIMNVEDGDDAYSADYTVKKGAHARIADLGKADGEIVNITTDELPTTLAKGNKMTSKANGTLEVPSSAPTAKYLEVVEITPYGCRAKVVVG